MTKLAKFKVRRRCAGLYDIFANHNDQLLNVSVEYCEHLNGWIAASDWDMGLHTDVLSTYRFAKFNAVIMIDQEIKDRENREAA